MVPKFDRAGGCRSDARDAGPCVLASRCRAIAAAAQPAQALPGHWTSSPHAAPEERGPWWRSRPHYSGGFARCVDGRRPVSYDTPERMDEGTPLPDKSSPGAS